MNKTIFNAQGTQKLATARETLNDTDAEHYLPIVNKLPMV